MRSSDCHAIRASTNSDTVLSGSHDGASVMRRSLEDAPGSLNFMTLSPLDIANPFLCEYRYGLKEIVPLLGCRLIDSIRHAVIGEE